jgi:hypothetical protein
LCISLECIYY